jgi:hypothetical protein
LKTYSVIAIAGLAIALPFSSHAGGVSVRAGLTSTTYDLEFDNNGPYANAKATSKYTGKNVGVTIFSDSGCYFDVSGQTSGDATHDLWKPRPEQPFSRDDLTLTIGVTTQSDSGSTSFFGGLKTGSSELKAPPNVFSWTRDTFDSSGVFGGVGFGVPVAGGTFGMNAAVAVMSGEWTDDAGFQNEADYTVGYSLGVNYKYMIAPQFGISVDYKLQAYSYDFAVYSGTQPAYTVVETLSSFGVNAILQF